ACAGDWYHPMTDLENILNQSVPGIGHQRCAGVGDECDRLALSTCRKKPWPLSCRIVFVIGKKRHFQAESAGEGGGYPRVLAGDHVDSGKRFQGTKRDVAEISDRRRHDVERRLQWRRRKVPVVDEERSSRT